MAENFFTGRTHRTKVGCSLSDVIELLSGVVQGSGLGPLMFVIYINELTGVLERLNITVKLFANDVKLYVHILDDLDIQRLQLAVDALCCWADKWQLSVSVNKCCVLNISKAAVKTDIYINGACLPAVESARDLGVLVTKDMSSQLHVKMLFPELISMQLRFYVLLYLEM